MKQEHKELLLKDISSRLPYGVKVQIDLQSNIYPPITCKVCNIEYTETEGSFIGVETSPDTYNEFREFLCKPYLFPLSSMTEEQREEYDSICAMSGFDMSELDADKLITFFHENHIDYRGLIEKGLAIDATNKNIY
jgi:hypothetical protein